MGGYQVKSCKNCRSSGVFMWANPCNECNAFAAIPYYDKWKTKRGRKTGSKSKPGTEKPGPKTKPSGEKMCFPVLSIKAKDLKAYGGTDKLKADVKLMVKTKLK